MKVSLEVRSMPRLKLGIMVKTGKIVLAVRGFRFATRTEKADSNLDANSEVGLMGPEADREEEAEEQEKIADAKAREINMQGGSTAEQKAAQHGAEKAFNSRREKVKNVGRKAKNKVSSEDAGNPGERGDEESESGEGSEDEADFVDEPEDMSLSDAGVASNDYAHSPDRSTSHSPDRRPGARRRSSSAKPSVVYIHPRPSGRRRESIRQQVFGKHPTGHGSSATTSIMRTTSPSSSRDVTARSSVNSTSGLLHPDSAHQGRGRPILSPKTSSSNKSNKSSSGTNDSNSNEGNSPRHRARDVSPSTSTRAPGIRFAPDTAESSETAPGPNSGFYANRRNRDPNPSLAMARTSSIQSNSSLRSARDRDGDEATGEVPAGQRYYKRPGGGGNGLGMSRSRSVQDIDIEAEAGEAEVDEEEDREADSRGGGKGVGGFLKRLRNR